MIHTKRAYEVRARNDGYRVLIDGIWPRGVSREQLQLDAWRKELAPSTHLRKWFAHEPERWSEFKRRYFQELARQGEAVDELRKRAKRRRVTLIFAAKDAKFNNAVALKEYLERRTAG